MDNTRTNVGELFSDEVEGVAVNQNENTLIASATTTFEVGDRCTIRMTKVVDRPGEIYFPGDDITFTITITNNGTGAATGLFFRDVIDETVVPETGSEYTVTTTSGTITSRVSPITISGIDIPAGETVTITISGVIAE